MISQFHNHAPNSGPYFEARLRFAFKNLPNIVFAVSLDHATLDPFMVSTVFKILWPVSEAKSCFALIIVKQSSVGERYFLTCE